MSRSGRMVIVPAFRTGGRGLIPRRVKTLGSVSVNHNLIAPSCQMIPANVVRTGLSVPAQ